MYLFAFLLSGAVGTFFGGPLSDKFGKKTIIFLSSWNRTAVDLNSVCPACISVYSFIGAGFILMSSFSVTVVYAQELVPGKSA